VCADATFVFSSSVFRGHFSDFRDSIVRPRFLVVFHDCWNNETLLRDVTDIKTR
jgi:hypothetical protein